MMANSLRALATASLLAGLTMAMALATQAQEQLPWQQGDDPNADPAYGQQPYQPQPVYKPKPAYGAPAGGAGYPVQQGQSGQYDDPAYAPPPPDPYQPPPRQAHNAAPPPSDYGYDNSYDTPPAPMEPREAGYGPDEITQAGHRFFGRVTTDLASVIEHAFQDNGRPNGYILGEEGGGAFVAGLRYGEGTLYTKNAGRRKVYWQGPSIGYDFGGEGSKTMILVYNMHSPEDVFYDYAGVGGQAYIVGGVGITYLKSGPVTMAPIRSGLGLRLGANVGYLKFTRSPTWNPF